MRMAVVLLCGALLGLSSCASSSANGACDPATETCVCGDQLPQCPAGSTCVVDTCQVDGTSVDAGDPDFPDASSPIPDGGPLAGFGEPCLDREDCASHICIFVGIGGRCTVQCAGGCPEDYGCYGVLGAIDPGIVAEVCVPNGDQLCSPCTADSECALIGMDKCLSYPDGDRFCGRDCSSVACPADYACADVEIDGADYRQCVPTSGACDCDASTAGATEACAITTPFGSCAGTRTCGGATGWDACAPPAAVDEPDGSYTDDDCDGIDGEIDRGIFVSGAGANTPTCGLTYTSPCQTISHGILRARLSSRTEVYVQTGSYNEAVTLVEGVDVWGGYDFTWQRGPTANAAHRVTIVGRQDGNGMYVALRAREGVVPITVGDVIIDGPDAGGTDGASSYGVHIDSAIVTLARVTINAGNGAAGSPGSAGTDAVVVDRQNYMNGGGGGNGEQFFTPCNSGSRGSAGGAGTNSCGSHSSRAVNGGGGGRGGTMDTDCDFLDLDLDATPGEAGGGAVYRSGAFGKAGTAGPTCGNGGGGGEGLVGNGGRGVRASGGFITGGTWQARAGGAGSTGEHGSGGGGGGGGGGCDSDTDAYGAGGGGGGAGGCAARGGGGGGGGGGGSFAVFVVGRATVTIEASTINRGNGGAGGAGGAGGRGQSGGLGAGGGSAHPGSGIPGSGANGAHGGHGGGGAGGQGGRAVGVLSVPDAAVTVQDTTIAGGSAGAGGSGGASAPSAPAAERDGVDGQAGQAGTLDETRRCVSLDNC